MSALFDALSLACLLALVVVMGLQVRVFLSLVGRSREEAGAGPGPTMSRLIGLSSLGAVLALGVLGFGAFGEIMNVFGDWRGE